MLGAMVAPVAHTVQALSVGWKQSEVCAEWVTAAGAVFAAFFAAWAVIREGRLLKTAQEQLGVSQRQTQAMQRQTWIAREQVAAAERQVEATFMPAVIVANLPKQTSKTGSPDLEAPAPLGINNVGSGVAFKILLGLMTVHYRVGVLGAGACREFPPDLARDVPGYAREFDVRFLSTSGRLYRVSGVIRDDRITNEPPVPLGQEQAVKSFEADWCGAREL